MLVVICPAQVIVAGGNSDGYYEWDTRCLCPQISKHCSGYKAKVESQVYPKSISQHVLHEVMERSMLKIPMKGLRVKKLMRVVFEQSPVLGVLCFSTTPNHFPRATGHPYEGV